MNNKLEYKGYFYSPNTPENTVAGLLKYEPNKSITLELFGELTKNSPLKRLLGAANFKIIHGVLSNSTKVTLLNCSGSITYYLSSKYPLTNFSCQYLILGTLINDINNNLFNSATIQFANLFEWRAIKTIQWATEFTASNKIEHTTFTLSSKKNKIKKYRINNDWDIQIHSESGYSSESAFKSFLLKENTFVKLIKKKQPTTILNLLHQVTLFEQFLSLAYMSKAEMTELILTRPDEYQIFDDEKILKSIKVLYINNEVPRKAKQSSILFNFYDISSDFGELIKNWYLLDDTIFPIREHLIDSIMPKQIFKSVDFLIITQSLEGYHRRFINSNKTKLLNRLKSLRTIFQDIEMLKLSDTDFEHAVSSRDYYSHFYLKDENVLEGTQLYNLTFQLRKLLICCVLKSIGMSNDLINKIINKYYHG